jgi:hypothetical protein
MEMRWRSDGDRPGLPWEAGVVILLAYLLGAV